MRLPLLLGIVLFLLTPCVAAAQTAPDLESQLAAASGSERGRILASLTDALRQDNPKKAITYGTEALALFAQHPDPANHVKTLNEMAWAHMTLSDYAKAVPLAEQGRDLATTVGDERGRARAINNLGVIAQRRGDPLAAVDRFKEALDIYRRLGNDLDVSMGLNNLGFVHATDLADYGTGLAYHVEALAVRERLGDKSAIALSLNNIGIIYHRTGDMERGLKYYERALELRRDLGVQNRVAGTLNNIGDLLFDRGAYERAIEHHTEALEVRRKIGDRVGIALSLKNLALVNTKLGHTDLARVQLTEALQVAASGDRTVAAQIHLGLAALDRETGATASAVAHAQQALSIARAQGAQELLRLAWQELSAGQERAGDVAGALASFKEFKTLSDRIFDSERSKRVELLERRYQAERREAELQLLRAQQALSALDVNQQKAQRNAIGAGAVAFGLVVIALYRRRVESARLAHRLSVTDALTGLKNRRYVTQTIDADTAISARRYQGVPERDWPTDADLVFVLVDIDHFKSINDQFGHEAGDRVLVQVAEELRGAVRTADTLVRWGGEEFLVVCRFTNRAAAALSAERIRAAIDRRVFDLGAGQTLRRTCSIGFATFPFHRARPDALAWDAVVKVADDALYKAKQSGRNAWVGYSEGVEAYAIESSRPLDAAAETPGTVMTAVAVAGASGA